MRSDREGSGVERAGQFGATAYERDDFKFVAVAKLGLGMMRPLHEIAVQLDRDMLGA